MKNLIVLVFILLILRAAIAGSISVIDEDEDGVVNGEDICPYTETDIFDNLGRNRWIWSRGYGWLTTPPYGTGPGESFTIQETHGCSCSQILNWLSAKYPDDSSMEGQWKFGCSVGTMREFILHAEKE